MKVHQIQSYFSSIILVEMKAVALLNVRNLAIGIVIAHQRSESPTSELEAPDYPDMAKCTESEPTNIVVKENIVEADVHCEAANHAAVEEDVSCSVSQQSSESDQVGYSIYVILLYYI